MLRGRWAVGVAVAMAIASPARADDQPSSLQKAALYAKASVVRVIAAWEITFPQVGREFVGGTGSGFFVSADGFVVTNAHVVQDIKDGEAKAVEAASIQLLKRAEKQGERIDAAQVPVLLARLKSIATARAVAVVVMPDGTRLDYTVKAYGRPGESNDVAVVKVDIKDAPNLQLAETDRVQVQDKILAIGYPGAADMQGTGLLDDKSQLEATVNDGSVSALKRAPSGETIIQINASITHGNSGGPAVNEKGDVIGLGTFGSTGEVQGFNFLVAASTVEKFVKQAKADTTPSKTITQWRKALDEYWAGDLDAAIPDFEEVMTLFPTHSEAQRVLKLARQAKKEGKGNSSSSSTASGGKPGGSSGAGIAVAIILVLVIVGVVVFFVIKSKKKPAMAGMHPGMAPQGMAPGMHPGMPPHGMPYGAPPGPPPGGMTPGAGMPMIAGRAPQPVAKTVAIGQQQHAPVAATAFGSLTMGSLTCTRGLLNGQRFSLGPQGLLIGRQPGLAQIVVNDSRASGKHVWIGFENGTLVAVDQGTTNGTFVNDVRHGRISKAPLKDGDTVIVAEPDCLSLTLKLS